MRKEDIVGARVHTIWCIANEGPPSPVGRLDKAYLDLDLAYRVVTLRGIELTLERFEHERFVSV